MAGKDAMLVDGDPGAVFVIDREDHTLIVSSGEQRESVVRAAEPIVR